MQPFSLGSATSLREQINDPMGTFFAKGDDDGGFTAVSVATLHFQTGNQPPPKC